MPRTSRNAAPPAAWIRVDQPRFPNLLPQDAQECHERLDSAYSETRVPPKPGLEHPPKGSETETALQIPIMTKHPKLKSWQGSSEPLAHSQVFQEDPEEIEKHFKDSALPSPAQPCRPEVCPTVCDRGSLRFRSPGMRLLPLRQRSLQLLRTRTVANPRYDHKLHLPIDRTTGRLLVTTKLETLKIKHQTPNFQA